MLRCEFFAAGDSWASHLPGLIERTRAGFMLSSKDDVWIVCERRRAQFVQIRHFDFQPTPRGPWRVLRRPRALRRRRRPGEYDFSLIRIAFVEVPGDDCGPPPGANCIFFKRGADRAFVFARCREFSALVARLQRTRNWRGERVATPLRRLQEIQLPRVRR